MLGTSEKGKDVQNVELRSFKNLLIVLIVD